MTMTRDTIKNCKNKLECSTNITIM